MSDSLKPLSKPSYLDGLNAEQKKAVEKTEGPVLVLAGAGTGKTRVLITRIAHILAQGMAQPWEVLAVTFTNKAALQMRTRVGAIMGRAPEDRMEGWWVGTFHALCARILRSHAEAVGLRPNFTILDADDQLRLIKQILQANDIDEKKSPPRAVLAIIQRWKDRGLTPDKAAEAGNKREADESLENCDLNAIYAQYQTRLTTLNAVDFGDLILLSVSLFTQHAEILERYQKQFKYVLVDEYQDSNVAQYLWLRLLARKSQNICCVGDDDQSIYSWRGAEVANILRFEKDFHGAEVIRLEQNYRSTSHILAAAAALITHNEGRLGKTLWTDLGDGDKVQIRGVWDGEEEARVIGYEIERLAGEKHPLNEIAILVRAGFQTREFEERLIVLGVPYRVIGGPRFYERQEIRDAVAYLRVIVQPDDDLAFERIVNTPKRGIGKASLQTLHLAARSQGTSLSAAVSPLAGCDELPTKARNALTRLMEDFTRWRGLLSVLPCAELAALALDECGYTEMWQNSKTPEAPGRLDNLKELVAAIEEFDSLQGFLEHVSLVMENQESKSGEKVSLMTLHSAKGLEFDTVFLPGWEEGLFPHQRALDECGLRGLEEERRLGHVGLTRAKRHAVISFAASRRLYGRWQSAIASRFIDELPQDNVEVSSAVGLSGNGATRKSIGGFRESPASFAGPVSTKKTSAFSAGQRIFHRKFGYGLVLSVEDDRLEISFDKAGRKRVMAGFIAPAEQAG
jgi:DNA helicase II / ATP-dependent DNA helicase PcrA